MSELAGKDYALLVMLARAAEAKGADRQRAIELATSAIEAKAGTRYDPAVMLAMFDEVETEALRRA